jgi:hypothetical protein
MTSLSFLLDEWLDADSPATAGQPLAVPISVDLSPRVPRSGVPSCQPTANRQAKGPTTIYGEQARLTPFNVVQHAARRSRPFEDDEGESLGDFCRTFSPRGLIPSAWAALAFRARAASRAARG